MNDVITSFDARRMCDAVHALSMDRLKQLNEKIEAGTITPFAYDIASNFTNVMDQIVKAESVWGYTALAGFYTHSVDPNDQVHNERVGFCVDYSLISISDDAVAFKIEDAVGNPTAGVEGFALSLWHISKDMIPAETDCYTTEELWSHMFKCYVERYELDNPFFRAAASLMCHLTKNGITRTVGPIWNDKGLLEMEMYYVWPNGGCARLVATVDVVSTHKALNDFIQRSAQELEAIKATRAGQD